MHEGVTGSSLLRVNVPGFRAALSVAIRARARKHEAISHCDLIMALVAKHVGLASVTKCCTPPPAAVDVLLQLHLRHRETGNELIRVNSVQSLD